MCPVGLVFLEVIPHSNLRALGDSERKCLKVSFILRFTNKTFEPSALRVWIWRGPACSRVFPFHLQLCPLLYSKCGYGIITFFFFVVGSYSSLRKAESVISVKDGLFFKCGKKKRVIRLHPVCLDSDAILRVTPDWQVLKSGHLCNISVFWELQENRLKQMTTNGPSIRTRKCLCLPFNHVANQAWMPHRFYKRLDLLV